ncbi:hypothetical protein HB777_12205 [Mesorhizobium loti]|nr:hypothetical protein HB777_12205 [Mesorhizobium loti]
MPREFGFKIGGVVDSFNHSMRVPRMAGGGMVPAMLAVLSLRKDRTFR